MAKILITGAAGFIGLHLSDRLLRDGHEVVLVDNLVRGVADGALSRTLQRTGASLVNLDCLDASAIAELPADFDAIFHLAAIIGVAHVERQPADVVMKNLRMLQHLLDLGRAQTRLSRFLFASTSEVYAGTLEAFDMVIPTPETVPLALTNVARPRTSYMLSKLAGESLCHFSGLPVTIFRPHNVYGPRMGLAHVIPGQLEKAHHATDGDFIDVPSVEQTRTFCYVEDAIEQLVRMFESPACEGRTLNLGTQAPEVTVGHVAATCHATVGRRAVIRPLPAPVGSPNRRCPDMTLASSLIGDWPRVSLEDGIQRTWAWYRDYIFTGAEASAR